jgi:hypothetical protein
MKKNAILNIQTPQKLYDKVKEEAVKMFCWRRMSAPFQRGRYLEI